MLTPDDGARPPLRLVQGGVGRGDGGEAPPQVTCRRQGAGATVEMLREAALTLDRALHAAEECVAPIGDPTTSPNDAHRAALARHAVRLMDLATDVPSPALRAAAMRAAADCRDLADVRYPGPTPDDVARAGARLEAVRVGCDILEEQLSDALRAMLRASLGPPPTDG